MVKQSPILFSGAMVNAILQGQKTQTRRVVKPQPDFVTNAGECGVKHSVTRHIGGDFVEEWADPVTGNPYVRLVSCPYGGVGDRLWVRESFCLTVDDASFWEADKSVEAAFKRHGVQWAEDQEWIIYRGSNPHPDLDGDAPEWKPSIHMPRWACRIELEITEVRVQRLQDIPYDDAVAEGCDRSESTGWHTAITQFSDLWDSINGKRGFGWDTNPWVWALTFRRVEK